jgi:hypothetical protein
MKREIQMDDALWEFRFGLEVSTLYHDWRRAKMEALIRIARSATFIGAVVTLLTVLVIDHAPYVVAVIIVSASVIIAIINLWELVSHLGEKALKHTELYRAFMAVQEKMAKHTDDWKQHLPEWEAEVIKIRTDEPPIMWAVYAEAWNQIVDRHALQRKGYYRQVSPVQHFLRNVCAFAPQNFPSPA